MPACRQMSLTGTPASACLRIETIWVSVKRDFFMEPPGWGKHARKFCLWGVCGSGKLTPRPDRYRPVKGLFDHRLEARLAQCPFLRHVGADAAGFIGIKRRVQPLAPRRGAHVGRLSEPHVDRMRRHQGSCAVPRWVRTLDHG